VVLLRCIGALEMSLIGGLLALQGAYRVAHQDRNGDRANPARYRGDPARDLGHALIVNIAAEAFAAIGSGDRIDADIEAARAQFEAGSRPEFDISCDITDGEGQVTGRLVARWTLKALRR